MHQGSNTLLWNQMEDTGNQQHTRGKTRKWFPLPEKRSMQLTVLYYCVNALKIVICIQQIIGSVLKCFLAPLHQVKAARFLKKLKNLDFDPHFCWTYNKNYTVMTDIPAFLEKTWSLQCQFKTVCWWCVCPSVCLCERGRAAGSD